MTSNILSSPKPWTGSPGAKDFRYFARARHDIVARLPFDPTSSVLEVGCGSGETGALAIAQKRARRYVGVELNPELAERASEELSEVIVGDAETMGLEFLPAEFDALIMPDTLDNLRDPLALLRHLHRFVRPGGLVLASSANLAHWKVIRELLLGRFPQNDYGAFAWDNQRSFTPDSFAGMFERAGYDVVRLGPVQRFSQKQRLVARLLGPRFQHLLMEQISIEAVRR